MTRRPDARIIGRAAAGNPPNRFETVAREADFEQLAADDELLSDTRRVATQFLDDATRTIITENSSPDVPFRYSVNPYRGCEHGCAYCYARPTHETLGLGAGVDFESRIVVKRDAAKLLRAELSRPSWQPEPIVFSGVTDCYQPAERHFRLTRSLLEVLLEFRHPAGIITKNALVLRDLDVLAPLAERRLVNVFISVTTLDAQLARSLEPRTSTPAARLEAIRKLTASGVPAGVMAAPLIPGLTDHELPAILHAASEAGALGAGYTAVRLPLAVEPIFREWLALNVPDKQPRIEALIRQMRGGRLNDPNFGSRMRGEGEYARQLARSFDVFSRRYNLRGRMPPLDTTQFTRPEAGNQRRLF